MATDPKSKPRKRLDEKLFREEFFRANGLGADIGETDDLERQASANSPAAKPRPSTGYANPPIETRFVKGKSGNPNGRPRKPRGKNQNDRSPEVLQDMHQIMVDYYSKPMKIRENDQVHEISRILGLIRLLEKQAAGGSVLATRHLLELGRKTMQLEADEATETVAVLQSYIELYWRKAGDPDRLGEIPEHWTHPEDIIIGPGNQVRIRGHFDEDSFKKTLWLKAVRNLMAIINVSNLRGLSRGKTLVSMHEYVRSISWIDAQLPTRWRVNSTEYIGFEQHLLYVLPLRLIEILSQAFDEAVRLFPRTALAGDQHPETFKQIDDAV
jgi:hypothetical protein